MSIKIFTEGGSGIGLGHISRCSSLFEEVEVRGLEVEFFIYGNIENIDFLKGQLVKNINWLTEDYLNNYINKNDYCIVDSYLASKNFYTIISDKSNKALFIDDNARIKYPKGIIVNPSLSIEGLNYPLNDESHYLLGAPYIILRTPFVNIDRDDANKDVKEVLITMGGSDLRDLTPKILNRICRKHPEIKFSVVIGNAFHNVDIIESIKLNNIELYYNIDADLMKSLMLRTDFAITAAGQTIYELLATRTPFIPIKIIANQVNNINGLKKINPEQIVIDYDDSLLMEKLEYEFILMLDLDKRTAFTLKYHKSVDGYGSKRIINKLLSEL